MIESSQPDQNDRKYALITGAHGMLGRFLCNQFSKQYNIITLGLNSDNDIVCDLSNEIPQLPDVELSVIVHAAGTIDNSLATAINFNGTRNLCQAISSKGFSAQFIFISSAAVYGLNEGENITEDAPLCPINEYGQSKLDCEKFLEQWCSTQNVTLTILRPPMILGTGMKGTLRAMVNGINNGYYFNIKGNSARRSIVHAKDLATAALLVAPIGGTYNITDRADSTIVELGEAMAHRINGKRIYSLPKWVVKLVLSKQMFDKLTHTLTFNCDKLYNTIEWNPDNVAQYLLTHQYSEDDI